MQAKKQIGILFESDEWSDYKLAHELQKQLPDASICLINMENDDALQQAYSCDYLISRIFASAQFRNHDKSLQNMRELISHIDHESVRLINPGRAHLFEIDKQASTLELANHGILVPRIFGCGTPSQLNAQSFKYPCIIKPNCGGRTTYTAVAKTIDDVRKFLSNAPDINFIVEEYIEPSKGFMTRIEIVGGEIALAVKRSIADNGLSAYHFGSTYEIYHDCPSNLLSDAKKAADILGFLFGSFDVIETEAGNYFIDANSVSNVSEDCTELFQKDLMACYAEAIKEIVNKKSN